MTDLESNSKALSNRYSGDTLKPRLFAMIWLFVILLSSFLAIEGRAAQSPFAKVEPIAPGEAHWTTGFWADRFNLCVSKVLPNMGALMEGTNYSQFFRNFEIAAGLAEGRYRGAPFNDGELYKLMEAASAAYAITHDDYFASNLDRAIEVIAKAQREDGYLHTPVLIKLRQGDTNAAPFQDRNNFEMYNMGHLMTAASMHYRVTGKTNFLAVARKAADFLYATFLNAPPDVARSSVCPSHYMGMVDLYRVTGDKNYLELARKFFELRSEIKDGGDDNQDRIPLEEQHEAVGHAVRANYLYAGAADLFMETGDTNLWEPLEPIWTNLVTKKMYITGGCGALYDGASPDGAKEQKTITKTHQAYGRNYQLPNITAHNETCANIANVIWNWRMFLVTGEARYLDVVELALYNSVLSGISLDGTNFFYTNPLRVTDPLPVELRWSRVRVPFVSSFCCPPNLARTLAESENYAYAKSSDSILVTLYASSTLTTELEGDRKIQLTQETEYPWNGRIRITINNCDNREFALKLRIPGWAVSASYRINHGPQQVLGQLRETTPSPLNGERAGVRGENTAVEAGAVSVSSETPHPSRLIPLPVEGRENQPLAKSDESLRDSHFLKLRRTWHVGDIVDLDLPMPARLMEANPLVEEDAGQVAVQRGPVIYCLESLDLPEGVRIPDVRIPSDIELRARYDTRLLDGVVVVEGKALAVSGSRWNNQLYQPVEPAKPKPIDLRLIPYSVWANRGPSEMSVWLPRFAN